MLARIHAWWDKLKEGWNVKGIRVPFARQQPEGTPSFTLFCVYIAFLIAAGSVIWLHFRPTAWVPTSAAIMFWFLTMVMYKIKNISKFKADLDDKSIELDDDSADRLSAPTENGNSEK